MPALLISGKMPLIEFQIKTVEKEKETIPGQNLTESASTDFK